MDHHVVALEEVDETMQQQIVRERGRRIKAAAELGLARSSRGRHWGRVLGRRSLVLRKDPSAVRSTLASAGEEAKQGKTPEGAAEEEEEEEVVEEKVTLLRQLVPGGDEMAVERLLEETADYIAALRAQVGVMRALACLLSGSGLHALPEKEGSAKPEKPL